MTFKTQLDDDANSIILNPNEFAEQITYITKAGSQLSINAIVERKRLDEGSEDDGRSLTKEIEVYIANDATNGVVAVNVGFDKVKLPENLGESNTDFLIIEILQQDEAVWHLRCTR